MNDHILILCVVGRSGACLNNGSDGFQGAGSVRREDRAECVLIAKA